MSQSPIDDFSEASVERYRQGWQALNRLLHENRSFSGNERHCAYLNTGSGRFANISSVSGLDFAEDGRAISPVDWDFDGDLDLWITNRTAPRTRLMLNQSATKNSYIALALEGNGTTTNRDAIGARVEVLGLSKPHIQTKYAGESFLSQSSGWLHFGLGSHTGTVDVLVRWPNAAAERFSAITPGGYHLLRQGSGQAQPWTPPKDSAAFAANDSPIASVSSPGHVRLVLPGGLPLPDLTEILPDKQERAVALTKKPTLINVWATWCQPCHEEIAAWSKQAAAFQRAGLEVLTLNADEDDAGRAKSVAILKKLGSPFRAAAVTPLTIRRLDILQRATVDLWEPLPVPSSFLVDSQGYVRIIYKGGISAAQVIDDLKLLNVDPVTLRNAAVPFPGKWTHEPSAPDPLRVTVQFVDHALIDEGLAYIQKAVRMDQQHRSSQYSNTDLADRLFVAGTLLASQGKREAAIKTYQQASKLNPNDRRVRGELAKLTGESTGSKPKTLAELKAQLKANPTDPKLAEQVAVTMVRQGQAKQALPILNKLVQMQPKQVTLRFYHGVALQRTGNFKGAIASFEQALKLDPNHALTANSIAWINATHPDAQYRNGGRSEKLARQLCQRTQFKNPSFLMTLAAAQAELGQFPEAAGSIEQAIAILRSAKPQRPADIKVLEDRLQLHRSGKPFRDTSL